MATATQSLTGRLSLDQLSETVEFRQLTPKQQLWLATYTQCFIDTGVFDPVAASVTAYDCGSAEVARITGYKVLANSKIILALNRFFGDSPEEAFLKLVERALYSRKISPSRIAALKLYSDLKGWSAGALANPAQEAETPESRYHVGDIVLVDGKKCRVNEVNKAGRPIDVDEVE
jgi:hypothetical protein